LFFGTGSDDQTTHRGALQQPVQCDLRHGLSGFSCHFIQYIYYIIQAVVGNNVSHSKRRTKRTFDVNLFTKKFYWVEQDTWISLNISAAGLRTINKVGLDAAIKKAAEKGFLYA
jgi:large subunit ribosomal protein L28